MSKSNIADVIRYIESQEEHHRKVTFQEELDAFLKNMRLSTTSDTSGNDVAPTGAQTIDADFSLPTAHAVG